MKNLDSKVAIVTGGGSGIGRAISILYASEGAKAVVTDIDEQGGNETAEEIRSGSGDAIFIKAYTSNPDDSKSTVEQTVNKYGGG